jgi:virulence-associated protein VagC
MLAKKTVKNQITLPKAIADEFPDVDYFEVRREDDRIILEPFRPDRAREVREKLASLGVKESDVADAVSWARDRDS